MNLQRRKFLRQAQQGGAGLAVGILASTTWMAVLHLPAHAGNQAEEQLSDSVRTALSQAVQQSGPPVPVLPPAPSWLFAKAIGDSPAAFAFFVNAPGCLMAPAIQFFFSASE